MNRGKDKNKGIKLQGCDDVFFTINYSSYFFMEQCV